MDLDSDDMWLVKLAMEQIPKDLNVIEALKNCPVNPDTQQAMTYFADRSLPNVPGSIWQFSHNIILEHPKKGTIVLDMLKSGEIGAVEIIQNIKYI